MFLSRFGGGCLFAGGLETLCWSVFGRTGMERDEGISVGSLHGVEDAAAAVEKGKRWKMMMMAAVEGGGMLVMRRMCVESVQ